MDQTKITKANTAAQAFEAAPIVKNYVETQNRYQTVKEIFERGMGGPGDLASVFEFMKGLDPTSVVRESEYATAAKSGNIFAGAYARFNGYFKPEGGFLPENVKKEFLNILKTKLGATEKQYENLRGAYAERINRITGGDDGDQYLTDFKAAFSPMVKVANKKGVIYEMTPENAKKAVASGRGTIVEE